MACSTKQLMSFILLIACVKSSSVWSKEKKIQVQTRIDEFVQFVMECIDIPGLSLAVVKDGELFMTRGYGTLAVDIQEEVTEHTPFLIASVTKAFVSTLTGMVLEENNMTFDDTVKDILGDEFYLSDYYRTINLDFRDVFGHRSGLGRNDKIRYNNYTQKQLLERMQYLDFPLKFRHQYNYNNIMYGIGSSCVETLQDGKPWEELLTEKSLLPLGMTNTTFIHKIENLDPLPRGHFVDESTERLRQVSLEGPRMYFNSSSASGSIVSTAEDMGKWLVALLNDGQASDGQQVISPEILQETHVPHMSNSAVERFRSPRFPVAWSLQKIALGWREGLYRGYDLSGHTGSHGGFISYLTMMPQSGHGVYLAMNRSPGRYSREHISMFIYDLLLDIEPWLDEYDIAEQCADVEGNKPNQHMTFKREDIMNSDVSKDPKETEENIESRKELEEYTGVFGNYAWGNLSFFVNQGNGHLMMSYGPIFIWDMGNQSDGDTFHGHGLEPFWYDETSIVFGRNDNEVTSVQTDFDNQTPPIFVKDIDWENPPPPPDSCF